MTAARYPSGLRKWFLVAFLVVLASCSVLEARQANSTQNAFVLGQ